MASSLKGQDRWRGLPSPHGLQACLGQQAFAERMVVTRYHRAPPAPAGMRALSPVPSSCPYLTSWPWPCSLVELTEEILKLLMELVFRLVCSGELSLARVLRKNILDKVDQKKLLRCANSDQPLAARGVAAR